MEYPIFDIRNYKETKIINIDEIKSRLWEILTFEKWYITTNPGKKNILVYRHPVTYEICIVKILQRKEEKKLIKELLDIIDGMEERCRRNFVRGAIYPGYFLMEYWHATVSHFLAFDFLNFSETKWEIEKSKIMYVTLKGMDCLLQKGLYYTDLKANNVVVRYQDSDPQKKLSYAITDLYAGKEDDTYYLTYRPPVDHGIGSLTIWGVIVLILQVWTITPNSGTFKMFDNKHIMYDKLHKRIPQDVLFHAMELYDRYNRELKLKSTINLLKFSRDFFRKRIDTYLAKK